MDRNDSVDMKNFLLQKTNLAHSHLHTNKKRTERHLPKFRRKTEQQDLLPLEYHRDSQRISQWYHYR